VNRLVEMARHDETQTSYRLQEIAWLATPKLVPFPIKWLIISAKRFNVLTRRSTSVKRFEEMHA